MTGVRGQQVAQMPPDEAVNALGYDHSALAVMDRPDVSPHGGVVDLAPYRLSYEQRLAQARQQELVVRAQEGDPEAMEELWLGARAVAGKVAFKTFGTIFNEEEITQIGLAVVPGVVERHDPTKGASLNTRLFGRMFGAVRDAEREHGRGDGISRHDKQLVEAALKSDDPAASLHQLTQPVKVRRARNMEIKPGFIMAPHLVSDIGRFVKPTMFTNHRSLDELLDPAGMNAGSYLPSSYEPVADADVPAEAMRRVDLDKLQDLLKLLPPREQTILKQNNGLNDTPVQTMEEIADQMGVTKSRVSQLSTQAMKSLGELWVLDTVEAREELANRLKQAANRPRKLSAAAFRAQLYDKLEDLRDYELSDAEIAVSLKHLPHWATRKLKRGDKTYQLLARTGAKVPEDSIIEIPTTDSKPRVIRQKNGHVTMLVRQIEGSDIQLALDIEAQLTPGA